MNNKEYISYLSGLSGYSVEQTQTLVSTVVEAFSAILDDGENIVLPNFGTFEVKKRSERIIVNPSTGQRMLVPPKLVLGFKPSSQIREEHKKGGAE